MTFSLQIIYIVKSFCLQFQIDQGKNVESGNINFRLIRWIKNASKQNKNDQGSRLNKQKSHLNYLQNSFHTRENN